MSKYGYISDFEALRTWFKEGGHPRFSIAIGTNSSTKQFLYKQESSDMDIEDAADLLEERLNMLTANGGTYQIRLYPGTGSNNALSTNWRHPNAGPAQSSVGGIGGNSYLGDKNVEDYIAEKISDKMENFELRRRMEDLEFQLDQKRYSSKESRSARPCSGSPLYFLISTLPNYWKAWPATSRKTRVWPGC